MTFSTIVSIGRMPGYGRSEAPPGVGRLSDGVGIRCVVSADIVGLEHPGDHSGPRRTVSGVDCQFRGIQTLRLDIQNNRHPSSWNDVGEQKTQRPIFWHLAGSSDKLGALLVFFGVWVQRYQRIAFFITYRMLERLSLDFAAGLSRLLGHPANAPIVRHTTQPFGELTFTYRL